MLLAQDLLISTTLILPLILPQIHQIFQRESRKFKAFSQPLLNKLGSDTKVYTLCVLIFQLNIIDCLK
jgi:hypothetical protein